MKTESTPQDTNIAEHIIGWREWLALPALGIPAIKAKIDTGAKTSALHAFQLETFWEHGAEKVRFALHPLRHKHKLVINCVADVLDRRIVRDSGGHSERRLFIHTEASLADQSWPIEISLTDRENMLFRMLLGRSAIKPGWLIDASKSYCHGRQLSKVYRPQ